MTSNAERIFDQLCELGDDQRRELLQRLCGDDVNLRAEVESSLMAHDSAGDFLGQPTVAPVGIDPAFSRLTSAATVRKEDLSFIS